MTQLPRHSHARLGRNNRHRLSRCCGSICTHSNRAKRHAKRGLLVVAALLWCVVGRSPLAHAGEPDVYVGLPIAQDGPGVKVGKRSTFHGGAAVSVGYDSNVFSSAGSGNEIGSVFVQPTAWLSLGNRRMINQRLNTSLKGSDRKVEYNIGAFFGWRFYTNSKSTVRAAGKPNGGVTLNLLTSPKRRFSFGIDERFLILGQPRQYESTAEYNLNRFDHRGLFRFLLRPGGGRLVLEVGYISELLYFLDSNPCPEGSAEGDCQENTSDRTVNGLKAEIKWRFRDRSAFVAKYRFTNNLYLCCTDIGVGRNEDSDHHIVQAGYVGQIGKKIDVELLAGYGKGIYYNDVNGVGFSRPNFEAALTYFPRTRTQLSMRGFYRIRDSLVGNYISDFGASMGIQQRFKWRMDLRAGFTVTQRKFIALPVPGIEDLVIAAYSAAPGFTRTDLLVAASTQLEQSFGKMFVMAARYDLQLNSTDFVTLYSNGFVSPGRFTRHVVWLFGALRY
jgi:hypothetical protein